MRLAIPLLLSAALLSPQPPPVAARRTGAPGWLALTPARDGFAWQAYRPGLKALVYTRGLKPSPVTTCFDRSETGSFFEQNPILLTCDARAYRVEVFGLHSPLARLEFSTGPAKQILKRWKIGDHPAELVFAGDLDGDSKLDLLIEHGDLGLYLSTLARPGQLLGRARL
ncbi:MAG: hypothetical protein ACK5TN_12530 [Acidobacteriota bacterium]